MDPNVSTKVFTKPVDPNVSTEVSSKPDEELQEKYVYEHEDI